MLLSIIIPTKNRQDTAVFAIKTAVGIESNDFEIIVHDCSDDNSLLKEICSLFPHDSRIKYFHTDSKPSMTENWNLAYSKANGEYLLGIGDDDGVLPEIIEITNWAKSQNLDAVCSSVSFHYYWPGFKPQLFEGTAVCKHFTGSKTIVTNNKERIQEFIKFKNPLSYWTSPIAYHAIIKKDLIQNVIKDTGTLFDSTCLDVYSYIVFGNYSLIYALLGFPLTIKGACKKSNTQRHMNGKIQAHLLEYNINQNAKIVPDLNSTFCMIANAISLAANASKQSGLMNYIHKPSLYAYIASEKLEFFPTALVFMIRNKDSILDVFTFLGLFGKLKFLEILGLLKYRLKIFVRQKLGIQLPIDKSKFLIYQESKDVLDASFLLKKAIEENKMKLKL